MNNIEVPANDADKLLNATTVNSLSAAVNGLNLQHAQLALSTKKLTAEQTKQVLVQAGLMASENQIQAELVQSALAQSSVSAEKQKAILIELGLMSRRTSEIFTTRSCTKEELLNMMATKGVTGANAEAILSTLGLSGANSAATLSFNLLAKSIWATISALAANPLTWVIAGIAGVVTVLHQTSNAVDEVRNKAQELGASFYDTQSDIETYKNQIKDLYATIHDSSAPLEDVTAARQTLMSVQDELIEKFGTEKDVINTITDAIYGQADALDKLTERQWQETKNSFNNSGFWNNVANWFDGYEDNVARMTDEMEDVSINLKMSASDYFSGEYIDLINKLENTGWVYSSSYGVFIKSGNLKELYSEILDIQSLVGNDAPKNFLKSLTKEANDAKKSFDDYGDMWDSYILHDRIFANDELADSWHDINEAYTAYQNAFTSGNAEDIAKAKDNFAKILTQATEGLDDESVIAYFNSMYPELQQTVREWNFTVAFEPNTDGLQDKVGNALDLIDGTADGIVSFSVEDIENFNSDAATQEQIAAYKELDSIAWKYGLTISQLIALLQSMGLVQSANYNRLADTFGQENISTLSDDELKIAYTIENTGSMTFDELQNEIKKIKDSVNETEIPLIPTLSSSIEQLSTQLEPQFTKLGEAYNAIFTTDGFTFDAVDNSMLESLRKSFAEIGEEIGVTFDPAQLEPFFEVLTNGGSEQEVQEAFNDLATAYLYSTDTLEQLNDETANAIEKQLEQMGVTNAEEVVAEALRVKNEELALSKEYLAENGKELTQATDSEVLAFLVEQAEAGNCGAALAALQLQKFLVNGTLLDTETDINNVMRLAQSAGIATETLSQLITLKAAYEEAEEKGNFMTASNIALVMDKLQQDFQDEVNNFKPNPVDIEFKAPDSSKSAASSSAAKQAETDWKNVLDKETDLLEKQLAANVITFKEYTDKRRQIIEDYYRDGKIKAEDYYDALESMYNHHLSLYDRVVNAVTDRIDDEIDKLKDQKEEIEKSYQVRIDAIQEEIDALNKANDARQKQIDLEKAQYDAERARNQRVNRTYDGSQFIYEADMDAVRDAEETLADKKFQLNISHLETQIESLKAEMENATGSLDNQINALEAYKDRWNEISGVYQEQQDKLLAAEIMGSEWERDVLNGRLDTLQSFTEQYIALQQAQADAAVNAAKIKAEAEAGNTAGGSVSDTKTDTKPAPDSDPKQKHEVVYEGTAKIVKTFNSLLDAQNYVKRMNKGIADDDFMYYIKDIKKYASGTDHARKGLNLVGEEGTETFIDNDGNVSLVTRPTLIPMEGGEVVKNVEETKAMLDSGNLEPVPEKQNTEMQSLLQRIRNMPLSDFNFQSIIKPLEGVIHRPNIDFSPVLNGPESINIVQNNTINCPNVTNNSGAEYIMKELKRLPLDTIQFSHRRH